MDRPANQDVEQHREEDDGHGRGYGDQNNLAVLAGDGEGCWKAENSRYWFQKTNVRLRL